MLKEWLRVTVPSYHDLPEVEKKAIVDFSLLWPLFEGRVLGSAGGVSGLCKAVDALAQAGALQPRAYSDELGYFRQRYFLSGSPTERFRQLHFRKQDNEDLVRAVLSETDSAPADEAKACLIIVYRYRNNLFHGIKWREELRGQLENLNTANSVLMKTLTLHGRLE